MAAEPIAVDAVTATAAASGVEMFKGVISRSLLCGLLAIAAGVATMPTAEAAAVRVRFTPPYGAPFPDLEWFGEAVIDDGGCSVGGGLVSNFGDPCAGKFSITSATLYFADIADLSSTNPTFQELKSKAKDTIDLTGGLILAVDRNSPEPNEWSGIISTPFDPVQGSTDLTKYNGQQAYFSLVFLGSYAQLIWFRDDPDTFLENPLEYLTCKLAGPGDNKVGGRIFGFENRCGLSSNVGGGGEGGRLSFSEAFPAEVPEPSSVILLLAGLGALTFAARRRAVER